MSVTREIDSKINIVDLVSRYIHVKKAWVNYKALCPFHNEKTPSFVISPSKNIAYCFSCHNWWWPVKFLSEIEKIPFSEAVHKLAKEAWIELKTDYYKERNDNRWDLYELHKIATNWYHEELFEKENSKKLEYLLKRWLSEDTIRSFKLWYSWDPRWLFQKLKDKWYKENEIIESWVFVSAFKDKFYWRIVFPISDFTWNIVAFTWRVLDNSLPKYLNSPATKIFDKSSILFWLHQAKSEISKKWYAVIVEWQMDVIALHQAWHKNTVWISWTALTQEQIKLLKRLTRKIYLSLDNDNAWIQATFSSLENTINEDIDIKILSLSWAKDPDEYLKSWKSWEDAINEALSPVSFYMKEWSKKYDLNSIQGKKELIKEVFQFLKRINSRIEVDLHMKDISNQLWISMDVLYEEFKNTKAKKQESDTPISKENGRKFTIFEEIAWYMLLYSFFDLFLENFGYNESDIKGHESSSILKKCILHKEGLFRDEDVDEDYLKSIELYIEEENSLLNSESIRKKFLDLVWRLNRSLFENEKTELEIQIRSNPENTELLLKHMELIKKWKQLKIIK